MAMRLSPIISERESPSLAWGKGLPLGVILSTAKSEVGSAPKSLALKTRRSANCT